jgi:hypothetical protein
VSSAVVTDPASRSALVTTTPAYAPVSRFCCQARAASRAVLTMLVIAFALAAILPS